EQQLALRLQEEAAAEWQREVLKRDESQDMERKQAEQVARSRVTKAAEEKRLMEPDLGRPPTARPALHPLHPPPFEGPLTYQRTDGLPTLAPVIPGYDAYAARSRCGEVPALATNPPCGWTRNTVALDAQQEFLEQATNALAAKPPSPAPPAVSAPPKRE
ncbi:unnamed protein product, partial [Effrenium voratum]